MAKLSFGKYAGVELSDIPREYVEWLISARKRDLREYEAELERRDLVESAQVSMVERLVVAGFRDLAKKLHPDQGGSDQEFQQLKAAQESLKMMIGEMQKISQGGAG